MVPLSQQDADIPHVHCFMNCHHLGTAINVVHLEHHLEWRGGEGGRGGEEGLEGEGWSDEGRGGRKMIREVSQHPYLNRFEHCTLRVTFALP